MNKNILYAIIALFFSVLNSVSAQEKSIILGGKDGWPLLSRMDGIVQGRGRFGYDAMVLATNSRALDSDTDLLVDFENGKVADIAGKYSVSKNSLVPSENSFMGKYAGLSHGIGGLRLRGGKNTIFGKQGQGGSLTIEFWLKPSIAENGEVVFSWRSSRTVAGYPLYQMITAGFSGNHLEWSFTNVFNGYIANGGEISLSSRTTIIPEVWMHHAIHFDQETGLFEYRINGLLEDVKFVTSSGHESDGSVFPPVLGVPADIDICPQYTGLIDDFRIQRSSKTEVSEDLRIDKYTVSGGRFETEPLLLSQGASLVSIDGIVDTPSETAVEFFVRSGDNCCNWTENFPEWISVKPGEKIKDVSGLYVQVAAELYPDGNGTRSPAVTQLGINYKEIPLPLAPFRVTATAEDGAVVLTWPYSVDNSVGGYYIFYGDRPGEYLGKEALEGQSPIDVGNSVSIKLNGLKNGKIYYFAVASYSKYDSRIMGELSREIFARPSRK
ncbi:LamG-like jellyroll fold domain-containing protein [Treponema sp.]|uniref:LamG-like jellyroll fold domain-containing protein n=1 Tax=Treponema sp. TaxID=166 RepID=UPI003F01A8FD